MGMSAEFVRRLADRIGNTAREVALIPVLVLLAILYLLPVGVPDLRRVAAGDDFAERHDLIVAWLDRHFELIEAAAPWLRPAGRLIVDRCVTEWDNRPWNPRPDPPAVKCTRMITCVYGCDGDLDWRLAELSKALYRSGWADHEVGSGSRQAYLGPPAWPRYPLWWRPTAALQPPSGLETIPPDGRSELWDLMQMEVGWASLDDPGNVFVPSERIADLARPHLESQPVEVGGDDVGDLVAGVLSRNAHVITIELSAGYYYNTNVYEKPGKLRKRLRPKSNI